MPQENKDLKVILSNIAELARREDIILTETDICFSLLGDSFKEKSKLQDILSLIRKYCSGASTSSLVAFLKEITKNVSFFDAFVSINDDNYETFSREKAPLISYVKNNFNDAAYLCFSKLFTSSKVSYASSFDEVCENVYNGICDYCILPIEDVESGKLFSFYSLIDKYDLKIFAATDIDEGQLERKTRYALLSRNTMIFPEATSRAYVEFSVVKDDTYDLSEILKTAELCSLDLYRIDTIPVPYNDLAFKFYHVFDINGNGLVPFIIYIGMKYPQFKLVGHYILV